MSVRTALARLASWVVGSRPVAAPPPARMTRPRGTITKYRRVHKHAVRLSALPISDAVHHDLGSGQGFPIGLKGESYRQAALHALDDGRLRRGEQVTFTVVLTPEALHDPNGIRVDVQGGAVVGYLSKEDAAWYRPVFDELAARQLIGVARARLIGGVAGKPSIGVVVDLLPPDDLLAAWASESQPF